MMKRLTSGLVDGATSLLLNSAHWAVRNGACTRAELERYLTQCEKTTREEYFAVTPITGKELRKSLLRWQSPISSGYEENDVACARLFLCKEGWKAPTLIFLHALMSAHDFGYCRMAHRLNAAGWNAALMHLPFHYSRVPRGSVNGVLALTSNLARNGETIRQAVKEARQLLGLFRELGCEEFGLIATSFGGWIGALLSSLEKDFSFIALLQPVADVEHAIWESPATRVIRWQLNRVGIPPGITRRHAHLTSPKDSQPLIDPRRIFLFGGAYDQIVPTATLRKLQEKWQGSHLIEVEQGHFGYCAMGAALREFNAFLARKNQA